MDKSEINWYEKFLKETGDRSMVIVSWAILDEELKLLLYKRLAKVSGMKNIIDNLSFCRKAAWSCMAGIISSSDYDNMKTLNELRNDFAHDPDKTEITDEDISCVEVLKKAYILGEGAKTKFKWFVVTNLAHLKNLKVERIESPEDISLSLEEFVKNIKGSTSKYEDFS